MANGPGWTRVEGVVRRLHTELRAARRGVSYHLRPHAYKRKGPRLAPASASERQFMRVFEGRALTSASQRWWALSPPTSPRTFQTVLLVLLQQRLEARVVQDNENARPSEGRAFQQHEGEYLTQFVLPDPTEVSSLLPVPAPICAGSRNSRSTT